MGDETVAQPLGSPVPASGDDDPAPEHGTALCLSGGGYRAMLFHTGVLWRLNDAGMLRSLRRISSVSGGSITAGVLGRNWADLDFSGDVATGLGSALVDPVRTLARTDIDVVGVLGGALSPWTSIAERVEKVYDRTLFRGATLQDLPDEPRFVLNATNLESGVLMRIGKAYLADYRVGRVDHPTIPLALAVTASSAFPPFLSPCRIDLRGADWVTEPGNDLADRPGFRDEISLSDGGRLRQPRDRVRVEALRHAAGERRGRGDGRGPGRAERLGPRTAAGADGDRQPGAVAAQEAGRRCAALRRAAGDVRRDPQQPRELPGHRPPPRRPAGGAPARGRPDPAGRRARGAAGGAHQLGLRRDRRRAALPRRPLRGPGRAPLPGPPLTGGR